MLIELKINFYLIIKVLLLGLLFLVDFGFFLNEVLLEFLFNYFILKYMSCRMDKVVLLIGIEVILIFNVLIVLGFWFIVIIYIVYV